KWFLKLIKLPQPKFPKLPIFILGFLTCLLIVFLPYNTYLFIKQLPNPQAINNGNYPVTTKIFDRNKTLLYEIYTDQNRTPVKLTDLPSYVSQAHLAIEDKNYYQHFGFDPIAIIRAIIANFRGQPTQGGSTITQQLVKFALLSPERTIDRKVKELILSFWAEIIYSKDEILEMYLNQIPYGGSAYGIEAAAKTYFGISAKQLSLAQAALLAGLPSAPSVYSPLGSQPQLARDRQLAVLKAMLDQKFIDQEEFNAAKNESLKFLGVGTSIKAPHFVMYVKDLLIQKYGIRMVEQGGLQVITTLDLPTYEMVLKEVKDGVEKQKYLNVGNGAILITNPKNGDILAMVGSKDYFDREHDGNVNVTTAQRSPGSSIKVVNYAAALEKKLITASSIIDDSPTNFTILGQPIYVPRNYDGKFHGPVTVRTALGSSYNIPAVKILAKLGVLEMINKGRQMGINSWADATRYGLSLTLGGGEVTMLDMATVYGTLANNGQKIDLNPIVSVNGVKNTTSATQVLSSQTAFILSDILSDNRARTPAFGPVSPLVIPNQTVAVKTGTADTKRDNWTIGYTPSYVVTVWVGNNDNSPMSPYLESGNTGAAAIWHNIMVNLLANKPAEKFTLPEKIIPVQICAINGLLPCENCPYVTTDYFVSGTEPKTACKIDKPEEKK
ncbi:MAG: transglycosylase domain-containing protein, partial [bacterium]|nr:transglycosylase domain-containing protein [bacterium]